MLRYDGQTLMTIYMFQLPRESTFNRTHKRISFNRESAFHLGLAKDKQIRKPDSAVEDMRVYTFHTKYNNYSNSTHHIEYGLNNCIYLQTNCLDSSLSVQNELLSSLMIVYNTRHAFILSSLSWGMRRYLSLSSDLTRWHLLYVNALADSYSVTFAQVWIWHWHNSVSNYHRRILSFNKRNPLETECGIASSNSLEHEWEVNMLARGNIYCLYICTCILTLLNTEWEGKT